MPTIVGGQQPPAEGEPRGQIRIAVEQFENAEESAVGTQVDVSRDRTAANVAVSAVDVEVGDTVVYAKYGGTEISSGGEELLILSARDVLAIVK